jgi:hypothetical protein
MDWKLCAISRGGLENILLNFRIAFVRLEDGLEIVSQSRNSFFRIAPIDAR